MKLLIKNKLDRLKNYFVRDVVKSVDKLLMISGATISKSFHNFNKINALNETGFQIYSQFDEDGIIEWLIQKIPASSKFVEFGVENYLESNTRFLLKSRNWKGLVMDSSQEYINFIKNDEIYWRHDLTAVCTFVTPGNIDELLRSNGFAGEVGILSIDAGGMDYYIWKAQTAVNPAIVICEYNAVFGDIYPLVIPYQEAFISRNVHYSGLYWGAGTKAFELLAEEKGYVLIGSNMGGNNLFFVRKDLYPYVEELIINKQSRPSLYRDSRSEEGRLTYLGWQKRFEAIKHLSVINLATGKLVALETLDVYSREWLNIMK
jgi:hypothetical protein